MAMAERRVDEDFGGEKNKSINMDHVNEAFTAKDEDEEMNNNANTKTLQVVNNSMKSRHVERPKKNQDCEDSSSPSSSGQQQRPTTYLETMMHLFKGNVGPGCFAMADAVKNGGLILAPVLTLFLGIVCVHAQHILVNCSKMMREKYNLAYLPDYAEVVELCFASSKQKRFQSMAVTARKTCNIFICVTQFGFCCVYFLFIGTNLKQVLDVYGLTIEIRLLITIILLPIGLSATITNLKLLAPFSGIANVCMITGLFISFYYASQDLPDINERDFVPSDIRHLPLYFGTAIFAFEGISLVLPLQNAMKEPRQFAKPAGVLNIGMTFVTLIFISFGMIGYWKYGDATEGSLTLNLPQHEILAQMVKMAISLGVLLGYAIQFFIPIQIMYPVVREHFTIATRHPFVGELLFRVVMVLTTFVVAQLVPNLSALLSLIGAVCSTVLALVFPPLIEMIVLETDNWKFRAYVYFKNVVILILSLLGFLTGTYESLNGIIKSFNS